MGNVIESVVRRAWPRIQSAGRLFAEQAARRQEVLWVLACLVALVPMIYLTYLVRHYGVEVPTLDDWEMAPLIVKAHVGQLTFADLFAQQQEARTLLPKLIFILSTVWGHWDVRDQMMLSVISCWFIAGGIFVLLRRSGLGLVAVAICLWFIVLTIFSQAQFELWIFASGFPSFLPALFLISAFIALGTLRSTSAKLIACAVLATASSFTLANGLLAWILTFPTLLLTQRPPRWRSWLGLWLGVCAICMTIYFWDYAKPANLPQFAPEVSPVEYVRFVLRFLGGSLAYSSKDHPDVAATIFGSVQLTFYLLALAYTIRRVRDRAFLAKVIPWFALGLYSIGSACLAALGRIGYGASYALASRYVTFSLYLTVAVIALIAIIGREIQVLRPANRSRTWVYAISLILAVTYLVPYKVCAANTHFFLRALSRKDRLARSAVLFSATLDTSEVINKTAYPDNPGRVVRDADALDRLKLIRPPLVRTKRLSALSLETADGRVASGSCESLSPFPEFYRASGWAILNTKGRPADCVLVAYQDARDQEWIACAISDSFEMRPDIVKRARNIDQLWAGWTATFSRGLIPDGARISFWAVNADEARLYRLDDLSSSKGR